MINYPKVKDSIMKQIIRNILFLALILLSSCELSMLEYELPEDQRGKGEPYTEVNEYGEFTYEYNKNVTPLNGDPQKYIATMNDSVLWFMDNMPDKWVPKAGEYIAANCSKTIPLGLCAKVRSVTRENGMIRVEHEPATREEVFKQLKVRLDFDYVAPGIEKTMGDSTVETRSAQSIDRPGFWKNDSTFVDMSLYDVETRANPDEYLDKEKGSEFSFFKPIPMGNEYLLVQFTYGSKEIIRVHEREDLIADYHEEWNDRYTVRTFKFLASISKDKDQKSLKKKYPERADEREKLKALFNDEKVKESLKAYDKLLDEGPNGRTIPISIPACPFSAVLRFELKYGFTLSAYGYVEAKYVSEAKRVGVIVDKGEKTQIDKKVDIWRGDVRPGFQWGDIRLGGSFDVWARVRAGVGVIVGKGAGLGGVIGVEFKGGFRASLEIDVKKDDPKVYIDKQNFTAGFYIAFGGYFEGIGVFGPWTITLHDFNFLVTEKPYMVNLSAEINRYSTDTDLNVENNYDDDTGELIGQDFCIETDLYFDKLETFFAYGGLERLTRRPALRIYEGTKDFPGRKVHQVVLDEVLEAEKYYKFNVNLTKAGLHSEENDFVVVPCVYDKATGCITEFVQNAMVASSGIVVISLPSQHQLMGRDIDEVNWETYLSIYDELQGKNREDFAEYDFLTSVYLMSTTKVKEWGVIVEMYAGTKLILERQIPYRFEGLCPSGHCSFVISFISQYKTPLDEDGNVGLCVITTPYSRSEGEKTIRKHRTSKCMYFRFPYNSGGYIPSLGPVQSVLL